MARAGVRRRAGDDLCCSLGRALRRHREAVGFSQSELARRARVDRRSVCQWEGGTTALPARDLLLLAAALGVPGPVLLEEAWDDAAPCTRLAVPGPPGPGVGPVRLRPAPRRPPGSTPPAGGWEPPPVTLADLDGLARLLAEAGLPAERAQWAETKLLMAAEDGVCQAPPQGSCRLRPAVAAARVDRAGKVHARAVCGPHARLLDHEWVIVGPGRPSSQSTSEMGEWGS